MNTLLLMVITTTATPPPTIIQIIGDDCGYNVNTACLVSPALRTPHPHARLITRAPHPFTPTPLTQDFGYQNGGHTFTPHIDALVRDGIELSSYHTYKVCAPSRASILTGRYPFGVGYYDMKGPEVVPVDFKMTPLVLREQAGYTTAMLGKWNLGHQLFPYTPTRRGFDTFFGYVSAATSLACYETDSRTPLALPDVAITRRASSTTGTTAHLPTSVASTGPATPLSTSPTPPRCPTTSHPQTSAR